MRLNKTIACATLLTQLVFGQNNTTTIRNLGPVSEEYTFPEIQTAPKTKIGEKINIFLQLHYLQHLPGVLKKTPLRKSPTTVLKIKVAPICFTDGLKKILLLTY